MTIYMCCLSKIKLDNFKYQLHSKITLYKTYSKLLTLSITINCTVSMRLAQFKPPHREHILKGNMIPQFKSVEDGRKLVNSVSSYNSDICSIEEVL